MKKIKEKPTLSERIKEKAVSTPRELLHRGLDDGSERLRTQLRDTAQHGQADEYGGDTIEDAAARGLRRAEKELTRQRKKKPQEQPPKGGAPAADATEQKPSAIKGKDTTSAGPQPQSAAERGRQQARQNAAQKAAKVKAKDTYSLGFGRAGGAPQEGHDLRAGAGLLGSEQIVAHAGGDAVLDRPLDGLIEVGVVGHVVEEVQHGVVLHEGRLDLDLARGHGEGVLAVALVLERQLVAVLVGDGQGLEDVAAVGLDGDGHGVALAGALRADGHGAVLGLARGRDGVGRVVGAAAAGVGRRVADRPDTVRGAAHIVIACQSAGGVCQIHAGGQTGFCKNRVGISALAASALDDVVCPVVLDLRARIKAERAAGDGDGLAARAAALLNFAIERAIFDIDNSCCVSCSISANNTGKCTVLNVDRTAGVVNIGSIRSGIGAALYSGGAAILNSHRTIQVRAISSSDIRNFDLAIFQCCIASNLHAAAVFCGQLHVGERCGLGFKGSA